MRKYCPATSQSIGRMGFRLKTIRHSASATECSLALIGSWAWKDLTLLSQKGEAIRTVVKANAFSTISLVGPGAEGSWEAGLLG